MTNSTKKLILALFLALLTPACGEIPEDNDPAEGPVICDMTKVFFVKKCFSGAALCRTYATATTDSVPATGCSVVLVSSTTGETYTAPCVESCEVAQ